MPIKITTDFGIMEVDGIPVGRSPFAITRHNTSRWWVLTHTPTGLAVSRNAWSDKTYATESVKRWWGQMSYKMRRIWWKAKPSLHPPFRLDQSFELLERSFETLLPADEFKF